MNGPPNEPGGPAAAPLDAELDRLFGFGTGTWTNRLRSAHASDTHARLGSYEIIAEIGRGGQGEVYRAVQPGTGRLIALKRIAGISLAASDSLRRRFEREVEAATRLSHPNVVTVHAAEVVDGHTVLIMELVEGEPIDIWADARWREIPAALTVVLRAFASACDGVGHAHQRAVIHRDLKPGNILVNAGGQAKVLDFGIAKVIDESAGPMTAATGFMGTPGYAAPERYRQGASAADVRSDVYSLGLVLFRVLTGRDAFTANDPPTPGAWPTIPAPSRFRALPRECDWIVGKATSPEPERRYQSVEALARDIRALLNGAPVEAAPPSTTYRLRKAVVRYRFAAAGIALIAAAMLGATVISLAAAARARAAQQRAEDDRATTQAALKREQVALQASLAAERQARIEAARQEQMANLMRRTFAISGAGIGGSADTTIRQAIDFAAEHHFPDPAKRNPELDPLVEATLRWTIGDTYLEIGRFDQAVTHLKVASEIFEAEGGDQSKEFPAVIYLLGRALRLHGDNVGAEKTLRRAVEAFRRAGNELSLAQALGSHGISLRWLNRPEEAAECYREAITLYDKVMGPDSRDASIVSKNLAILLSRAGQHEEAVARGRRTVEIQEKLSPKGNADLSNAYNDYGSILWAAGQTEEAVRFYRKSIEMDEAIYPKPEHRQATNLIAFGNRLDSVNRHEEALEIYLKAHSISEQASGQTHIMTLEPRWRAARQLRLLGRLDEAESLCRTVVERESLPPSLQASLLAKELAEILIAQGRTEVAAAALQRAWDLLPSQTPTQPSARAELAAMIVAFHEQRGNAAEAERWRKQAQE
jgi:tetratricopeptide (TPR) repeat protein